MSVQIRISIRSAIQNPKMNFVLRNQPKTEKDDHPENRVDPSLGELSRPTPWRKLKKLNWKKGLLVPHGISGLLALTSGFLITMLSFIGNFTLIRSSMFWIYLISAVANTVSAIPIISGPVYVKECFRLCIYLQLGLLYQVFRFRPTDSNDPDDESIMIRIADVTAISLIFASMWKMVKIGFEMTQGNIPSCSPPVGYAVIFSTLTILPLLTYPLHVAFRGTEWIECVTRDWPSQTLSFVAFVYIPTTWMFMVIAFAATLHNRKIISSQALIGCLVCGSFLIFFSAVLAQEYHMQGVATQKMVIFCPKSTQNSIWYKIEEFFDNSKRVQKIMSL